METKWLLFPRERRLLVFLGLLCSGLAVAGRFPDIGNLLVVAGIIYGIVVGVAGIVRWGRTDASGGEPYDIRRAGYIGLGLIAISLLLRSTAPEASDVLFWAAFILNMSCGVAYFVRKRQ